MHFTGPVFLITATKQFSSEQVSAKGVGDNLIMNRFAGTILQGK